MRPTVKPISTSNAEFLATIRRWIESNAEVFVVIRFVSGAGSRSFEFFTAFDRFLERLAELNPADSVIVMRDKQLPLRGLVDEQFVADALSAIPDGADWLIACLAQTTMGKASWFHNYPGNNHTELADELRDDFCLGHHVAVGLEPSYMNDSDSIISAYVPNEDGAVTPGAY